MNRLVIALLTFATTLLTPALAQAEDIGVPDTLYFGDHGKAYGYPGGIFCVPVYVATDQIIIGLSFGIKYESGPSGISYDSIGKFDTIFLQGNYLDLTHGLVSDISHVNGVDLDTIGSGGAASTPANALPIGRYKIGDCFFHGKDVGSVIAVDSAYYPPAGRFIFAPLASSTYVPRFVTEPLTIVAAPPQIIITSPSTAIGDAGSQIQFSVSATAAYPPVTIVLNDIVNVATDSSVLHLPPYFGTNPITVVWTPTYFEDGEWIASFTATDALGTSLETNVNVTVVYVEPPCQVFRGDANCDDRVNISDVVYLILYIFAGGTPPGCGK